MDIDQAEELSVIWIHSLEPLQQLIQEMSHCDIVALDTEFIKRDTYYPILALIQVNTGKHIYLIDAPTLDLTEFWFALQQLPLMVWHACSEDLSIIYSLSELPVLTNVFDTQLALAYLTGDLQVGYQAAVQNLLDIYLDKAHSKSDWLTRPLEQEQEHYAVDDVRYLLPLYHKLVEQLNHKQLYQYVLEETHILSDKVFQSHCVEDDEQYVSFVSSTHNGQQRYFLQQLLSWRESVARSIDKPRTFILRKQGIKELLLCMPKNIKSLKYQTSIHRSVIADYGQEILAIVQQAHNANTSDYPDVVAFDHIINDKSFQKKIKKFINTYAETTNVPDNLIIKKKWQGKLIQRIIVNYQENQSDYAKQDLPLALQGWRYPWVRNEFLPFLIDEFKRLKETSE